VEKNSGVKEWSKTVKQNSGAKEWSKTVKQNSGVIILMLLTAFCSTFLKSGFS
jgi:hypothetical protein